MKPRVLFALAVTAVTLLSSIPAGLAQNAVDEFTAFAINTNRRPTPGPAANRPSTATLTFRIERWSTDEERNALLDILKEEQNVTRMNDRLLRALQRMPSVGRIRETSSIGWDLRFAQQTELPDGARRIVLATDRPIGMWEATNRPRSIDYPFTVLEFRVDKNNEGEGKLLADTRLIWDRNANTLVLENFDISPVRLNRIRPSR